MSVFETSFAKEIGDADLGCLYCPSEETKQETCLAERYLKAYEIKEKHGLLTELEKQLLPGLRMASRLLLKPSDTDGWMRDEEAYREAASQIWDIAHGRPYCLQPAQWLEGINLLQAK